MRGNQYSYDKDQLLLELVAEVSFAMAWECLIISLMISLLKGWRVDLFAKLFLTLYLNIAGLPLIYFFFKDYPLWFFIIVFIVWISNFWVFIKLWKLFMRRKIEEKKFLDGGFDG